MAVSPTAGATPPSGRRRASIGEILVDRGLVKPADLERMLERQSASGERLGEALVAEGLVSSDDISSALAEQLGIRWIPDDEPLESERDAIELVPPMTARSRRVLPLRVAGESLEVAMSDPLDLLARDDLARITRMRISPVVVSERALAKAIDAAYAGDVLELTDVDGGEASGDINLDDLKVRANDAPIVQLVNSLISKAIHDRASDIHVEPQKKRLRIRYRVDGVLSPLASVSRELAPVVISRIKILADMDIAERRLPQDGRFSVVSSGKEVDLRTSSLPGTHGEKMVLRILTKDDLTIGLDDLELEADQLSILRHHISRPRGLILLTGPTGSGKTTTLYAALSEIDRDALNVVTVEDPVEYQLAGIHQVQVNTRAGLTFASGLRTILRQDPDVVMVGEIRDRETAEMAIRAALTGHLVLSTLHANDAMGTVSRLVNMGIEPFLIAEALSLVGAQRLVRRTCPDCAEPRRIDPILADRFGIDPAKEIPYGKGCGNCRSSGFRGRFALLEICPISPAIRRAILDGGTGETLQETARREGMPSLLERGMTRAKSGATTPEEIIRVCAED